MELARMGYLAHGVWVPEFLLETPEVLRTVHLEFVHCGSDVTEAFQVYNHVAPSLIVLDSLVNQTNIPRVCFTRLSIRS